MREAFPELGVRGRIGVTTGEVVTGTEERLATGDAVNVAARLQQAAQPDEILIGAETRRADPRRGRRRAARAARPQGQGRGRAGVPAPVGVRRGGLRASPGRTDGRTRARAADARGGLGAGRLRAVRAICSRSSARPASASRGWLPSSWARLVSRWSSAVAACPTARASPTGRSSRSSCSCRRPSWSRPRRRRSRPSSGNGSVVSSSDEIAWAFRKLLEAVATERPLVCVFDDVHWGEETFLDLIEHVADLSRDAPILLLCMARPDLLDRRPGLGRREGERDQRAAGAARAGRDRAPDREPGHLWTTACASGSARRPRATRCSSRRWSRWSASHRAARSSFRRRSRRSSRPGSTSSTRPSAACSSAARSRGASSTAARCRRSRPTSRR